MKRHHLPEENNDSTSSEEESEPAAANRKTTTTTSSASKTTSRLGKCEVCAANEARYACPKCEVKTCRLACVQIHKKELSCDGIRDRTKYIPLRQMSKMDFMNDYYFLEEATRFTEDRKHDRIKRFTRYNKQLPTHLMRLRAAAAERGISLRFLLQNFSRHKENTTYYDWKKRTIFWRIEWTFSNAGGLKYVDKKCAENVPLAKLLDKYLNPQCTEQVPQKKSLEYYQSVGVYNLKVLLKSEGIKRSGSRFYILDVSKSLKENLKSKTLVEFPCIYLSYESNTAAFDIIESDEDIAAETKSYQSTLDSLYKEQLQRQHSKLAENSESAESAEQQVDAAVLKQRRRAERQRKRKEFEAASGNYLFADEKLWEMFSTSESSSEETIAEAKIGIEKNNEEES